MDEIFHETQRKTNHTCHQRVCLHSLESMGNNKEEDIEISKSFEDLDERWQKLLTDTFALGDFTEIKKLTGHVTLIRNICGKIK